MGRETTWFQIADVGGFEGEELSTIGQLRDQSLQIIQLAEAHQQEVAAES